MAVTGNCAAGEIGAVGAVFGGARSGVQAGEMREQAEAFRAFERNGLSDATPCGGRLSEKD
jgi:hypothetical protein